VFLHPAQREIIERRYAGPARVSGSAGTGKTVVALHRAVELARRDERARVLLATFSEPLASALHAKLRRLVAGEPRLADRLEVHSLDTVAERLYRANGGRRRLAGPDDERRTLESASVAAAAHRFTASFLRTEWADVVDAWQIGSWEAYRDVPRLGRRTRLAESQRRALWTIFSDVRARLAAAGVVTTAGMYAELTAAIQGAAHPAFTHAVVDEAQDVSVPQLRLLAALGGARPDALFFAGDLGQRIFQLPFSWRALGVDVRGRSSTLRVNYRTSHQIRMKADLLLPAEIRDADGTADARGQTISAFNGPAPVLELHEDADAEVSAVAAWLKARIAEGLQPHELGVFVRSEEQIARARAALNAAGIAYKLLDDRVQTVSGHAAVGTMHLAKGLEFRAVAVMACDDEVLPLQERIEAAGEQGDLEDIYDTERHLLYVACTRARDQLSVSGVEPGSEFLGDFRGSMR
jgi:superfamily I DNA/RNA helicase